MGFVMNWRCYCQDDSACNYNPEATDADFCEYAEEHYDCDGSCLNDSDGDGVCDELEIAGCQDESACNYNPDATDSAVSAPDLLDCGLMARRNFMEPPMATHCRRLTTDSSRWKKVVLWAVQIPTVTDGTVQ